ncbi:hypothetical protein BcepSauron_110 [Burkholderia phage BcepSauron]|uniref:Uncharacterized protein n=1 Tax=Burkholderia phage BcepSauron TaxID=2530033 RepID=A0A482MN32_9CAUD|nr:hypothetical protein H1O17_gp110 [Burkholderia phage BcepSauron]QBQ74490.1 hypothetical protein BcepSauron_110 [Burkholderia phage BcepSauron]
MIADQVFTESEAPLKPGYSHAPAELWGSFISNLLMLRAAGSPCGDIILAAVRGAVGDPEFEFSSPLERGAWKSIAFPYLYSNRH